MNEQECPKIQRIITGLASEGKAPCELCAIIDALRKVVASATKQINTSEAVKAWKQMQKEFQKIHANHWVCAGCGLCFGGKHLAEPVKFVKDLGHVCRWCDSEIKEWGLEKFLASKKRG